MIGRYILPLTAQIAQRQLVANVIMDEMCREIIHEHTGIPFARFMDRYKAVPVKYPDYLKKHFGDNILTEVQGIMDAICERIAESKVLHDTHDVDVQLPLVSRNAILAEMATTTAEVRALNDILGF